MGTSSAARVVAWLSALALLFAVSAAHAILPIQHWQTKSGARVYFVENRDLPILDVAVDFPAGSAFDTREKSGLASMTNHLLRFGADGLSEDELARGFADVGAQFASRFDSDRGGVGLRTLSSAAEREQALGLLLRILRRPEFPQTVLEREKVRAVDAIREADTKPEALSERAFQRLVYRDHPYSLRGMGEVDSVQKMTRTDLVDFYRRHYTAQHAVVSMTGDLTRKEAEALAERIAATLPRGEGAAPATPPVPPLEKGVTQFVPHPASQSHIVVGAPGLSRGDPDYFALLVGNFVLGGGGFVSRVNMEVRQKLGLAYSASSYFYPLKREGPFMMSMQTQRERALEALTAARKTLRDYVAEGPTEAELIAAKQNIVRGFPLRIDTNRKINEHLALIGVYGLPLTYLDDYVKDVERVTVADVKRAFQKRIDPERMVTVVVGPAGETAAVGKPAR
jgi:zinc protease